MAGFFFENNKCTPTTTRVGDVYHLLPPNCTCSSSLSLYPSLSLSLPHSPPSTTTAGGAEAPAAAIPSPLADIALTGSALLKNLPKKRRGGDHRSSYTRQAHACWYSRSTAISGDKDDSTRSKHSVGRRPPPQDSSAMRVRFSLASLDRSCPLTRPSNRNTRAHTLAARKQPAFTG